MNLDPRIDWRIVRTQNRRAIDEWPGDGPAESDAWLSPNERLALACLRDASRREGWLQARLLAKQLLLLHERTLVRDASEIDVASRDASGRAIRPRVTVGGRRIPWSLSISHTDTAAMVALCTVPGISVGVDLVRAESPTRWFLRTWFDGPEREIVAAGEWREPCRIWAVKEAVYKAANRDDPFAPRQVQVRRAPSGGYTCVYRGADLTGWCRIDVWLSGEHVVAMAEFDRSTPRYEAAVPAASSMNH